MSEPLPPQVQALLDALIERDFPPTQAELARVLQVTFAIGVNEGALEASERMLKRMKTL